MGSVTLDNIRAAYHAFQEAQSGDIEYHLHLCEEHGFYVRLQNGEYLIALGVEATGDSLLDAITRWCSSVEEQKIMGYNEP